MLNIFRVISAERQATAPIARQPEPEMVMNSAEQVKYYHQSCVWGGVTDGLHLYNLSNLTKLIQSGDRVLDLGCGSADLLLKTAQLYPDVQFTGVDLSDEMLGIAAAQVKELGLTNVQFIKDDVTQLNCLAPSSYDVVMSTMAVHHLPTEELFQGFRRAVAKVVKANGAIYICDFLRLKSLKTIELFAKDTQDRNVHAIVKDDYIYSMRAAFSEEDFRTWVFDQSDIRLKMNTVRYASFLAVIQNEKPRVRFFKRRTLWGLPLRKISLSGWLEFALLKILCTRKINKPSI